MLHTPRRVLALLAAGTALVTSVATGGVATGAEGPTLEGEPARAGREARLSLVVPADPRRPTSKVQLHVPAGMSIGSCAAEAQWTCRYEPRTGVGPAVLEWVRRTGAGTVTSYSLSLTVAQPGRYELEVTRVSAPGVTARFRPGRAAAGPPAVLEVEASLPEPTSSTATSVVQADDGNAGSGGGGAVAAVIAAAAAGGVAAAAARRRRKSTR